MDNAFKLLPTNELLTGYLDIKSQISVLEKTLKLLAEAVKAAGDMETDRFTVAITTVTQNRVVGAEELLEKVGPVKVTELELIKTSTYEKITVKQKLQKAA